MKSMELEMYGDPFLLETQQELKKDHVTLSWFPVVPIAFPPEKKQDPRWNHPLSARKITKFQV